MKSCRGSPHHEARFGLFMVKGADDVDNAGFCILGASEKNAQK